MSKVKKDTIEAKGFAIQIYTEDFENDYISLTDIARYKNVHEPKDVVKNWLRVRDTIEFLGLWETINNPNFKGVEFDSFKARSGSNLNRAAREQLSLLLRSSAADGLEGGELGSGRALPSAS